MTLCIAGADPAGHEMAVSGRATTPGSRSDD
jgi:hypothetical protein